MLGNTRYLLAIFRFFLLEWLGFATSTLATEIQGDPNVSQEDFNHFAVAYFSPLGDTFVPDDGDKSSFRLGTSQIAFKPDAKAQDTASHITLHGESFQGLNVYPGLSLGLGALSLSAFRLPGNLQAWGLGFSTVPRPKDFSLMTRFAYTKVEDGGDFCAPIFNGELLTSALNLPIEPYVGAGFQFGKALFQPDDGQVSQWTHTWRQGYAFLGLRISAGPIGLAAQLRGTENAQSASVHGFLTF